MLNKLKTFILMLGLMGVLMLIGNLVGGRQGMIIAFVFAALMNFFSYWHSDKIVLKLYRAEPASRGENPELFRIVEDLASRANIPVPGVYILPQNTPNAFATGRNPSHAAVAVTRGIISILNRNELEGVIAHELSHVKNRDILVSTVAATMAGAIMLLASMARWAAILGGGRSSRNRGGAGMIGLLLAAIIAPLAAMLIQMAISRSREYLADRDGAEISGNPQHLAEALRKLQMHAGRGMQGANEATAHMFIVHPLKSSGLSGLFSTHPDTEERIRRLQNIRPG